MPRLSVVIPHWPIDGEVEEALHACLASLPHDCERLVIANDGTGFAHNVNAGIALATGDFIAVVTNDTRVMEGDVYDLCVPATVTSPTVLEKPGIEPLPRCVLGRSHRHHRARRTTGRTLRGRVL